ncbi:hypothetical protein CRV01_05160 [Arcobacter sp. CECT 8983]|uniref:hypothetical protein n=1 Tax=Arcobacter sp. CECT 8983 TaxID=2044508 RepID=UPI00100BCA77|nr:hypothetical protein [Arcobacter sp. CECT 8983]RXJ90546.1 hypothetical protein CRV01_05160 [Arcobacter sp. CECT 8983]
MTIYKDINGDSGVLGFEIDEDRIVVEFRGGSKYLYTYTSTGNEHIENMKELAKNGDGLNSYINKNVRNRYEKRLK